MVRRIIVLGGGTAGFTAALTLKRLLPVLDVRVVRSPDIGIIGVGEGTNITFAQHFIDRLQLPVPRLISLIEPTLKLGLRLHWGPKPDFFYAFAVEHAARLPSLKRAHAAYLEDGQRWTGPVSALMAHGKAFHRGPDRRPRPHRNYAFHVENHQLATGLETLCLEQGVVVMDATVAEVGRDDAGVTALTLASGERLTADLYVDASGFRSELLGRTLGEPWRSFRASLFCDRAVIGGWERTDEPVFPYTLVETMDAGWCWRIEHAGFINRGYVYSSAFLSDDAAREEFLSRNPKVAAERTRVVPFVSGRFERSWVGNVVAIGNASGFVEPLEATAIQVICSQSATLAGALEEGRFEMSEPMRRLYNRYNGGQWDDIRDFLSLHYRFNTRLATPFWEAARNDTDLAGAAPMVEFWQEHGPSALPNNILISPSNTFGLEGYFALLGGMAVPVARPYQPTAAERSTWRAQLQALGAEAARGCGMRESLAALRGER
jgi:tryptophan halogenase